MQKVLQPLYFAREDTKRPFYCAAIAMVINAVLAVGLAPLIGYLAAAIGTTLAGWGMLFLLWRGAKGMGEAAEFDARFKDRLWRMIVAAILMGAALWVLSLALAPLATSGDLIRFLGVTILCFGGLAVYGVAGLALKAFTLTDLRATFRK